MPERPDDDATRVMTEGTIRPATDAAPAKTVNQFLKIVQDSQLVSAPVLAELRRDVAADAKSTATPLHVAQRLVKDGLITAWQGQQMLAGKSQFFLGRYKFLDRLGVGGMGAVFKAEHQMMGRVVALKMIRQKLLEDTATRDRFLAEIKAVAALKHPNIVTAYDADHVGDNFFFVMEYVDGKDLRWWVKQSGPFAPKFACDFCRQAALGLQHAHERGLVHRDIKPGNLMAVRETPNKAAVVKIMDFGLSRLAHEAHASDSIDESVMGTFGFMAPEQIKSPTKPDIRSDIFSLGCTLFYLLTEKLPYPGDTDEEHLTWLFERQPLTVRSLKPDIAPAIDQVIAKMIARDPKQRFQTPHEVAEALWPFTATTVKSYASTRLPIPISPLPAQEPFPAMKLETGVDPTLNEFATQLTNEPTNADGLNWDVLLRAERAAAPTAPISRIGVSTVRRGDLFGIRLSRRTWRWLIVAAIGVATLAIALIAASQWPSPTQRSGKTFVPTPSNKSETRNPNPEP